MSLEDLKELPKSTVNKINTLSIIAESNGDGTVEDVLQTLYKVEILDKNKLEQLKLFYEDRFLKNYSQL
tara:strand:- start:443 stop:649 length:207 start_codon:yes stop_codon:yes gene_type:complete